AQRAAPVAADETGGVQSRCGIALACDMRVAGPGARFGITPAKLGLVYPLHDVKLLVDLVGPGQARRMLYTGMLLGADEAKAVGLVEELAMSEDALVAQVLAASPFSTQALKGFVRHVLDGAQAAVWTGVKLKVEPWSCKSRHAQLVSELSPSLKAPTRSSPRRRPGSISRFKPPFHGQNGC
ncbi:MAG: hypothetical protein B7Y31_15160, partial [Novosphingobium sp. 16-62-11]